MGHARCPTDLRADMRAITITFMKYLLLPPVLVLAACGDPAWQLNPSSGASVVEAAAAAANAAAPPPVETLDPTPPPPPPPSARTVEQFDTTTAEERAAAVTVEAEPAGEQSLGSTNVSLGPPASPGIWLETGLVTELKEGRAEYNGNTVNLELRPSGGPASAGSQMSLAAMRLLEIPLTALADVDVFAK